MRSTLGLGLLLLSPLTAVVAQDSTAATHADTLRGSIGPARAWWDVAFYDLHVSVNPADSTIRGVNQITYRVLQPASEMQIDLQRPLQVDSFVQQGQRLRVPPRRQRVLRLPGGGAAARASKQTHHGLLPRPPAGREARAVGRRPGVERRQPGPRRGSPPPARDSAPASGGPTRTPRPTSPTASGSPSPFPTRSRTCPTDGCARSRPTATGPRPTSGSSPSRSTTTTSPSTSVDYAHFSDVVSGRERGHSRSTTGRSSYHLEAARSGSSPRSSRCCPASSTGSARTPGTRTATSWSRRRTSGWSTRAPSPTATTITTATWARTCREPGRG